MKEKKSLKGLYLSMLKIGCIGFGGGSALIPVIEREVVEEQKLVSEENYNKDVVVACITPGALPVEISTGLGKRAGGLKGMMMSAMLMALPGVAFTIAILALLSYVSDGLFTQIQFLSIGLGAFICCLLAYYCYSSLKIAAQDSQLRLKRSIIIMLGVFVLTCGKNIHKLFALDGNPLLSLSTVQVLGIAFFGILYTHCKFNKKNTLVSVVLICLYLACAGKTQLITYVWVKQVVKAIMTVLALWGLYTSIVNDSDGNKVKAQTKNWKQPLSEIGVWILFMAVLSIPAVILTSDTILFLGKGFLSSIISFGGGDAYLSVADGMFVDAGTITDAEFYSNLVPVANILPGSILCKILTGTAYYMGYNISGSVTQALIMALAGFGCSVAASGSIFCAIYYVYENFQEVRVFQQLSKWIRPIIAGLLLNVLLSMFYQNLSAGSAQGLTYPPVIVLTIGITALDLYLLIAKKKSNFLLMGVSAIIGLIVCNLL